MKNDRMKKLTIICPYCQQVITSYPLAVENKEGLVHVLMACPICGHGWGVKVSQKDIFFGGDNNHETPKK
jgi:C4-type Zn-finger protein